MHSPPFEPVKDTFFTMLKEHPPGFSAQFEDRSPMTVYYQNQCVVDLHGSATDTPPITSESPFLTFSVSRGFTTAAILRLLDEGLIELDAPIGEYWPDFAQRGKETATVRHALLHQAGIPAQNLYRQLLLWPWWPMATRSITRQQAIYPPGTQTAYHIVNFGFILGEVVHRVSGMPIDQFLAKKFFEPMGLNQTWMRIPIEDRSPKEMEKSSPRIISMSPSMRKNVWLFNLPIIRRALIPAACLHSNARGLAGFFQSKIDLRMLLNGGKFPGTSLPEVRDNLPGCVLALRRL